MAQSKVDILIKAHDYASKKLRVISQSLSSLTSTARTMAGAFGLYFGVRGLVGFFKNSIEAAKKQEDAMNSLRAALRATADDTAATMDQFQQFAAQTQRRTIYGDEAVLEALAYAKNLGVVTGQMEDATVAAVGLAAKFNIDLKTAMMLIGRASQGQTQMLTRYGILVDITKSKQEQFNQILQIGADAFYLAEAAAETTSGKIFQAKNTFGDLQETIAGLVLPVMGELADVLDTKLLTDYSWALGMTGHKFTAFAAGANEGIAAVAKFMARINTFNISYQAAVAAGVPWIPDFEKIQADAEIRAETLWDKANKQADKYINSLDELAGAVSRVDAEQQKMLTDLDRWVQMMNKKVATPMEVLAAQQRKANEALVLGLITDTQYQRFQQHLLEQFSKANQPAAMAIKKKQTAYPMTGSNVFESLLMTTVPGSGHNYQRQMTDNQRRSNEMLRRIQIASEQTAQLLNPHFRPNRITAANF